MTMSLVGNSSGGRLLERPHTPEAVAAAQKPLRWQRLVAVGLIGGSLVLDHQLGRRRSRDLPAIAAFDAAPGAPTGTAVLVTAGFNSIPWATAEPLRETFTSCGRLALLHDSGCKFSLEHNYQAVAKWVQDNDIENLVMYGPSMGSMINVAMAPRLKKELDLNLFMLLDSSPYSYDDIKGAGRRGTVRTLSAARRSRYTGGPMTRLFLETLGYNIDNWGSERNPVKGFIHAFNKARDRDVPSNAQCLGRADYIFSANLDAAMAELQDVPFIFIGAEYPENDSVVNVESAFKGYQSHHLAPILRFTHPEAGHANPGMHPEAWRIMVSQALRSFGLLEPPQPIAA